MEYLFEADVPQGGGLFDGPLPEGYQNLMGLSRVMVGRGDHGQVWLVLQYAEPITDDGENHLPIMLPRCEAIAQMGEAIARTVRESQPAPTVGREEDGNPD